MADIIRAKAIGRESIYPTPTAGTHTILSGESGYCYAILALALSADGTEQVTIQDDTASLMDMYLQARVPYVMPETTGGWLLSHEGEDVSIALLNGGVHVYGVVVYRLIPASLDL